MSVFGVWHGATFIAEIEGCPLDQPQLAELQAAAANNLPASELQAVYIGPDPWAPPGSY